MNPELRTRIISGVTLGIAVLALTLASVVSFALLVAVGALILMKEWWQLTRTRHESWLFAGVIYISAATLSLLYLRAENLHILLALFIVVWTGDITAYLVGKRFGRHKIVPTISPGKSWEGLAGSVVASAAIAALLGHVAPLPHALLGAVFALLGLAGDLFESSLKRRAGVKDSGSLIPGHGGLFDRVDALLPCAILAAVALFTRLHY